MKIKDVMVRDVKTCTSADSLNRAAQLMWEHDCGVVPVVDADEHVIGIVTDRDVCMAAYTKGRTLHAIRVDEVMSRDVKSCRSDDDVAEAEALMCASRVRRVPVTDPLGRIAGIVSLNDLARAAAIRPAGDGVSVDEIGRTLGSICRPWCELSASSSASAAGSKRSSILVPAGKR